MLPFTHVPKEREKKCDKVTITQSYRLTIQKASLKKKKNLGWSDHNRTVHIIFLYFDFLRDCFDLSIIGFACAISYLMKIMTKNLMRIVLDYRGEKKCIENMFSGSTFCNPANLGGKGSRETQIKKWSPHFQLFMAWIFTFVLK